MMRVILRGDLLAADLVNLAAYKETTKDLFMKVSTSLEIIALEIFASHG